MDDGNNDVIVQKARQIFSFLEALDQHRNPVKRRIAEQPWHLDLAQLPRTADVELSYPTDAGSPEDRAEATGHILRVRRPSPPSVPAPPPPPDLRQWLNSSWGDPGQPVTFVGPAGADGTPRPATSAQDAVAHLPGAQAAEKAQRLLSWVAVRDRWAKQEVERQQTMALYDRLYGLRSTLVRRADEVELLFGDGLLNWRVAAGGLHHPILLQQVELSFDPQRNEFVVREGDAPVELYSALLRGVPGIDGTTLNELRIDFEHQTVSPVQRQASVFLARTVQRLSARGVFLEAPGQGECDWPRMWRGPVLFLRRRSLGFARAIAAVLDALDQRSSVSAALTRVVGFETERDHSVPHDATDRPWAEPQDVLLSREANAEQIDVARRLAASGSVVVQGPPGTGKTHTIANLIGHLLAHGQTVLVTSHTAKSLTVLREKVAKPLQPLCISVLGNDIDHRRQLEDSVTTMIERTSNARPGQLESSAALLRERRRGHIVEIDGLRQRLINARRAQFQPVVVNGSGWTPAAAARALASEREHFEWLPLPIRQSAPLPLSTDQIAQLYKRNSQISLEDARELAKGLPDRASLPTPAEVAQIWSESNTASALDRSSGSGFWKRGILEDDTSRIAQAREQVDGLIPAVESLAGWQVRLIDIAMEAGGQLNSWVGFLDKIDAFGAAVDRAAIARDQFDPTLSSEPFTDQLHTIGEILAHFGSGGSLGFVTLLTKPSWKRLISGSRVGGREPTTPPDFEILQRVLLADCLAVEMRERWGRQAASIGLQRIETTDAASTRRRLRELSAGARAYLDWPKKSWGPLTALLSGLGLDWDALGAAVGPQLSETPHFDRMVEQLRLLSGLSRCRENACRWEKLVRAREEFVARAASLVGSGGAAVALELAGALRFAAADDYDRFYAELIRLEQLVPLRVERDAQLRELAESAPTWAKAIAAKRTPHDTDLPPGDPAIAWQWRQIELEIDRRENESLPDLQREIEEKSRELRAITTSLIETLAWAEQVRRIDLPTRQALVGWQTIVRKMPKTSTVPGKLAALRKAAADSLRRCRRAVPVWVMPLARVAESFDFSEAQFDVVIIDEASQTDVMGLLPYFLAHKVLVVGDHEQVSPLAVGQDQQVVQQLIQEHLEGIPNAALYDGQTSIYDLARQSSKGSTCLLEHFRCAPEIIHFSNELCYEGRIQPLRDARSFRVAPSVVPYFCEGPFDSGRSKVNPTEALAIASLILACAKQPEYENLTFGVISLLGEEQALEIDQHLQRHLSPEEYEARQLVCGNAAQFQGDERDVMFLSVVDTPGEGPLRMRDQPMFRQRFNVAASRARDQLWVVHSLDPATDLKPGDLRKRLIEHARNPEIVASRLSTTESQSESEFERLVAMRLRARGYVVKQQYRVGYYRIDMVVEDGSKRLAIECDGDRWHPIEKLGDDMARQAVLERLGWRFARIRSTHFFRGQEAAMQPVFAMLKDLGIEPAVAQDLDTTLPVRALDMPLISRVILRAAQLRAEWTHTPAGVAGATALELAVGHDEESGASSAHAFPMSLVPAATPPPPLVVDTQRDAQRDEAPGPQALELVPAAPPAVWPAGSRTSLTNHPVPERAQERGVSGARLAAAPYSSFDGVAGPDPRTALPREVARGLHPIVSAEGPMLVKRAYDIYLRACGVQRLGGELKKNMNQALREAIAGRRVVVEDELGNGGFLYSIVRTVGSPPVRLRERGPRTLEEIPPSELQLAALRLAREHSLVKGSDEHLRMILEFFDLRRLTAQVGSWVLQCIEREYRYGEDGKPRSAHAVRTPDEASEE